MSPQLLARLLGFRNGMALCVPLSQEDVFGPYVIQHGKPFYHSLLRLFLEISALERGDL